MDVVQHQCHHFLYNTIYPFSRIVSLSKVHIIYSHILYVAGLKWKLGMLGELCECASTIRG